jgi:hypothetical protein
MNRSVSESRPSVDEVLSNLRGNRETFREILTNKDALLAKLCRYAKWKGEVESVPPWSIVGEILGHGSGVSSAIYELYRE